MEYTTDKTVEQAKICIKDQLRKVRPIICPEKTPKAYLKLEVGEHTRSHNSNLKVRNDLTKIARYAENRRLIAEHDLLSLLMPSDAQLDQIVHQILYVTQYEYFNGQTLLEAIDSGNFAIYTGSTKRSLGEEALRWLTRRGSNNDNYQEQGQRNRPVWRWENDDIIGMKDATDELGAKSFFVYYSPLRLAACYVEDGIQSALNLKPLGIRLHRAIAKGRKKEDDDRESNRNFLCKVFFTIFPITEPYPNPTNTPFMMVNNFRVKVIP